MLWSRNKAKQILVSEAKNKLKHLQMEFEKVQKIKRQKENQYNIWKDKFKQQEKI